MIINENNQDIDSLIDYLNQKIVNIRNSNILSNHPKVSNFIKEYYDVIISKFYKRYLLINKEIEPKLEQILIDGILDLINLLNKLK